MRPWISRWFVAVTLALVAGTPAVAQSSRDVGREMEREYGILGRGTREGAALNERLDRVVERIVPAVNELPGGSSFRLRSATILGGRNEKTDRVVNAFALPDGRIYVTLGLLRALNDSDDPEAELAFVVGHEITHIYQRHSRSQNQKALQAGLLAAVLGAVTRNRTVGDLAGVGAAAYVSSYSRKDEYRADKGGLEAMYLAGYDPDYAAKMLARLQRKGENDSRFINGLFGSHPLTENRIRRVNEMSADLKAGRGIASTEQEQDRRRSRERN